MTFYEADAAPISGVTPSLAKTGGTFSAMSKHGLSTAGPLVYHSGANCMPHGVLSAGGERARMTLRGGFPRLVRAPKLALILPYEYALDRFLAVRPTTLSEIGPLWISRPWRQWR